ncbi:MAG: prenyltransferase/squalene oxidase repeat-containing protein [bacterium]|jgi:prenyltransferase beta subunit
MLQVARLAPEVLGEAKEFVRDFIHSKQSPDGGFQNREGKSDLYYSVFGIESLLALREPLPATSLKVYLQQFDTGQTLDFVSLTSLIRCRACLHDIWRNKDEIHRVTHALERYRSRDGGYSVSPQESEGTAYGCFLALGAYQDLELEVPDSAALTACIHTLRSEDGAFSNLSGQPVGMTTVTAAAVSVLHALEQPVPSGTADWLLGQFHQEGGFFPFPDAPLPDLLSTATALHALEHLHVPLAPIQEACLDFLDSLWCNRGGFYGHWADDAIDCEYTYYGLLSLGHLSL